jgi:DNA-binding CsgD family transcriptional regulator
MAEVGELDEVTRDALARLTEREKDCLRRWLNHQTAKEMALDLGISPFGVEKRLKMARAKLGASSSLDAARLLAAAEGYGRSGPEPPDLASDASLGHRRLPGPLVLAGGIVVMSIFAASLIIIAAQVPSSSDGAPAPGMRKASWDETAAFLSHDFDSYDKDGSGLLDPGEASLLEPRDAAHRDKTLPPPPPKGEPDPAAEAKWIAKLDIDRDGGVSRGEYISYMMPWMLLSGIPKDWKPGADRHG